MWVFVRQLLAGLTSAHYARTCPSYKLAFIFPLSSIVGLVASGANRERRIPFAGNVCADEIYCALMNALFLFARGCDTAYVSRGAAGPGRALSVLRATSLFFSGVSLHSCCDWTLFVLLLPPMGSPKSPKTNLQNRICLSWLIVFTQNSWNY